MVKTLINIHMDNFDAHAKDVIRDVFEQSLNCDVILRVGLRKFTAHKAVLAFSSDFLKELIEENAALQPGFTPTISVPDIDPEIVEQILNFIYTGETHLKEDRFKEFVDVCNLLKLKSMANYEYVKYVSTPYDTNSQTETIIVNEPSEQQGYMENVTILGDDYAEIVKSVTQEETETEEAELLYETNPLGEQGNYDVIEIVENQEHMTEDEQKPRSSEPPSKRKRVSTYLREGDPKYKSNLDQAMHEVIYNKVSFKTAAEKYSLSKTILWRMCQQSAEYQQQKDNPGNQELNQTLLDELAGGETLLSISRKYNIPVSTLHRRKTMLFEKGDLPENVRIKQRNRGEDFAERLDMAITEVENGLSQTEASKKYKIPKTTIWRRLKRLNPRIKMEQSTEEQNASYESYEIINSSPKEDFKIISTYKADET